MNLHPLTHSAIALLFCIIIIMLPITVGAALLTIVYIVIAATPSRTGVSTAGTFARLIATAAFFLLLIHGISLFPLAVSIEGVQYAVTVLVRIAVVFTALMYVGRNIRSEELYALLLDLHVPPLIILILFRTIWLVPHLKRRMDEVVMAQRLRGLRIHTPIDRFKAIIPALSVIFTSMIEETSTHAMVMTTRGFLAPGNKTHLTSLHFTRRDGVIITLLSVMTVAVVSLLMI